MAARKRGEIRRLEIIENVLASAGTAGPARLTVAEIATAVGITQAAVFRHFPTKDDLWTAVGARIERETDALNADILACPLGATGIMEHLVRSYVDLARRWPALPLIVHSQEIRFQNGALQACFGRIEAKLFAVVRQVVDKGRARGEFQPDLCPGDAALVITALIRGMAMRAAGQEAPKPWMERLWPVLVHGLKAD